MPRGISTTDIAILQNRLWSPIVFNPSLWLDAADVSTISVSTGVSIWRDKSGRNNNATQSNSTFQPNSTSRTINGIPALEFDGSNDFFTLPNGTIPSGTSPYHFAVVIISDIAKRGGIIGSGNYGTSNQVNAFRITDAGEGRGLLSYWWANDLYYTSAISFGSPIIAATEWSSSTTDFIYYNASLVRTGSRTGKNTGTGNNTIGTTNTSEYFDGLIGEILIFNKILTLAQRQTVEGYFAWKWGLRSVIPSTHPFANRPPMIGD